MEISWFFIRIEHRKKKNTNGIKKVRELTHTPLKMTSDKGKGGIPPNILVISVLAL